MAAQGIDRLFARRAAGSAAMDKMRRRLTKEKRLLLGGVGPYADVESALDEFVTRVEAVLDEYDAASVPQTLAEGRSSA